MDPLQQQLMMRAQQSPDAGAANAMAHPPLPGAPPASISAPTPPGPGGAPGGIDPGMIQKLLAMLKNMGGGQGTGMLGPAAPMHGMPQQSGPQAGGNFMDAIANAPGMQRLKGIVGM